MKQVKGLKKVAAIMAAIVVLGTAGAAFAATYKTPADIVSELTGKTVDELNKEREAGKTYGTIADEAGKLDGFKAQMLEQKKAILDQRVKDGALTQDKADEIYSAMKERQATCDGTGGAGLRSGCGAGTGGCGMGKGFGRGAGRGMGSGFNR